MCKYTQKMNGRCLAADRIASANCASKNLNLVYVENFKKRPAIMLDKPLTNLQLELLKLYSMELSEEQLKDVQRLLANYFAKQAGDEMDRLWEEQSWNEDTMKAWLAEKDSSKED